MYSNHPRWTATLIYVDYITLPNGETIEQLSLGDKGEVLVVPSKVKYDRFEMLLTPQTLSDCFWFMKENKHVVTHALLDAIYLDIVDYFSIHKKPTRYRIMLKEDNSRVKSNKAHVKFILAEKFGEIGLNRGNI